MAFYNHSNTMEFDESAEPRYGPEVPTYPASFVQAVPYMHPQYMEPYGGPVSAHNYEQPTDGYNFVPPPNLPGEVQHFQHPPNSCEYAAQFDAPTGGRLLEAPLALEPPAMQVPAHLQDLCTRYVASYDYISTPNADRMRYAQDLALALLQYHYPESAGYIIQPSSLGPVARHGLNLMLKAADGSDPNFSALPPKKDPKKGKQRKLSKKHLAEQIRQEALRQFDHHMPLTMSVSWHMIEAEDIAGFEVLKKIPGIHGSAADEYRPYTYLAIMIDDLQTFPLLAGTNDVQRGDILTDVLCRGQHIFQGHGILLFGTRLEFYDFYNGAGFDLDAVDAGLGVEEPVVTLGEGVDLRGAGLQCVEYIFKHVAASQVVYLDGHVAAHGVGDQRDAHGDEEVAMSGTMGE